MNIEDIKKPENIVYKKTPILTDNVMHYCPGCSHGTVHKLVAEVIEEMGIQDKTIAISPVGCSVFAYNYLNVDWQQILLHLFNFTILFGALYILLYKPVKDFMAKREEYYSDMDSKATQALAEAEG